MALSVSADFMSCIDEEEEDKQVLEVVLRRQPSCITFDVPRPHVVNVIMRFPVTVVELFIRR